MLEEWSMKFAVVKLIDVVAFMPIRAALLATVARGDDRHVPGGTAATIERVYEAHSKVEPASGERRELDCEEES